LFEAIIRRKLFERIKFIFNQGKEKNLGLVKTKKLGYLGRRGAREHGGLNPKVPVILDPWLITKKRIVRMKNATTYPPTDRNFIVEIFVRK
jgi:hypothetical protein